MAEPALGQDLFVLLPSDRGLAAARNRQAEGPRLALLGWDGSERRDVPLRAPAALLASGADALFGVTDTFNCFTLADDGNQTSKGEEGLQWLGNVLDASTGAPLLALDSAGAEGLVSAQGLTRAALVSSSADAERQTLNTEEPIVDMATPQSGQGFAVLLASGKVVQVSRGPAGSTASRGSLVARPIASQHGPLMFLVAGARKAAQADGDADFRYFGVTHDGYLVKGGDGQEPSPGVRLRGRGSLSIVRAFSATSLGSVVAIDADGQFSIHQITDGGEIGLAANLAERARIAAVDMQQRLIALRPLGGPERVVVYRIAQEQRRVPLNTAT